MAFDTTTRSGRRSNIGIVEHGQAEVYLFPLSGPEDVSSDREHIDVPLYRGTGELMDKLLGINTAGGRLPANLDTHFFPRFVTLLLGRGKYSVTPLGTSYRHRWGIDASLYADLQKKSGEATAEYFTLSNVKPGGFAMTGAVTGPATYNPAFTGTGEEGDGTALDASPTADPFVALSNLNGMVELNGEILPAAVTAFTQEYSADLQDTPVYFYDFRAGIVEGDPTDQGQLTLIYGKRSDYYDLANSEARPSLSCAYANKKWTNFPTQWVRFMRGAVVLTKGMPRMGGKNQLVVAQRYAAVPYDVNGGRGWYGEALAGIVGPYVIAATDVDLHFKIDGGATITKTLPTGTKTAAQLVTAIGSFAGGKAIDFAGRLMLVSNSKGTASTVQLVDAGANSAHDVLGFDLIARSGVDSEFVIEVVNDVASYATW